MSTLGTNSWLPQSTGPITSCANDPRMQPSVDHDHALSTHESAPSPGPTDHLMTDDPSMPHTISRFAPFDERPNELTETPRWQKDLDGYFTCIFKNSVLSKCSIDGMALRTLQVLGGPTQAKIRGLALAVYTHWTRIQFRCRDTNASASEIVALISKIAERLGWISTHARKDFLNELNHLCIEKLKLTWHWYVAVVTRGVLPMPRENLFVQMMAIIAIVCHLFRGGLLKSGTALDGLTCIATMSPWTDAVAIIYALLHELGPTFALEQAGWNFIQRLLADLYPFTLGRVCVDPLCQLVSAVNALVAEWHNSTPIALYHTHP